MNFVKKNSGDYIKAQREFYAWEKLHRDDKDERECECLYQHASQLEHGDRTAKFTKQGV